MMSNFIGKLKFGIAEMVFCIEVCVFTFVYYYFCNTGYGDSISAHSNAAINWKCTLIVEYLLLLGFFMFYAKGYRFRIIRVMNLTIKKWRIIFIVNLITYLQLYLIYGQLMSFLPLIETTLIQFIFVIVFALLADRIIDHYHTRGQMVVIGNIVGLKENSTIDGYKICLIYREECSMLELNKIFELTDKYEAVALNDDVETADLIIDHCLQNKKPVYVSEKKPLLYGMRKARNENDKFVLILGKEVWEEECRDRIRAYLT